MVILIGLGVDCLPARIIATIVVVVAPDTYNNFRCSSWCLYIIVVRVT
jgi:hypothetical protein